MKRVVTAIALVPAVVYVVLWANSSVFLGVLILVACLCYREYEAMAAAWGLGTPGLAGYGAGLLLLLIADREAWLVVTAAALAALVLAMRADDLPRSLAGAGLRVMGILYVFGSWRFARDLHNRNPHWLLYALLVNWAGDIGAYYVGRAFGTHKLAERISPNKTWEGALGAFVVAMILPWLLRFSFPFFGTRELILTGLIVGIGGQLGDLSISVIKRDIGTKDMAATIPGHGGILDRIDSLIYAAPLFMHMAGYYYPLK